MNYSGEENKQALDLYSTSQTNPRTRIDYFTGVYMDRANPCVNNSPLVAYVVAGKGYLSRGNCNHWDCPRCGEIRAREEYRRIVNGCEVLALDHQLYFWTLPCRGREISLEQAEESYYEWTNVLLTNARTKCHREGKFWAYVQVTERQHKTRSHPHSHIISAYLPQDAISTSDAMENSVLVSEWFTRANLSAGLGAQHKITEVRNAAAVSRYVSKYLFKDSFRDRFPPKWKRVRYSRNFPKLERATLEFSIQLNNPADWKHLDALGVMFEAESVDMWRMGIKHAIHIAKPADALTVQP
jgi:hypothetical protein